VLRAAWIAIALLLCAGTAHARIELHVAAGPAQPRGTREDLPFSQFPDRSTATGHRYDLYCPHTVEPNPLVIIALDVGQTLERAESIAHRFARSGLIAVVVSPAPDFAAYLPRIGAVLDEVLAAQPLEAREPGCERQGPVGAWGAGRGGGAVATLANARAAAGAPFAAVVTVYAGTAREVTEGLRLPLLEIERDFVLQHGNPGARSLFVVDGEPCFLSWYKDPCRQRDTPGRAQQTSAIYDRSRQFFRAFMEADAAARLAVDRWDGAHIGERPSYPDEERARPKTHVLLSLPLLLGGSSLGDGGFLYGFRPELMISRVPTSPYGSTSSPGFGCGLYGELLRWDGNSTIGAGLTCVAYLGGFGIAPSIGLAKGPVTMDPDDGEKAVTAGLFVGFRDWIDKLGLSDLPVGVRFDAHFGYDGSNARSYVVAVQLDLLVVGGLFIALLATPIQ
jgi:hypothetical protein